MGVTDITSLLREEQQTLFRAVLAGAVESNVAVYLVGGAIRDWLLGLNAIDDLDFVVEGNAIAFAERLQAMYGGEVLAHTRFNTATWTLNEVSADIAMARSEVYAHPASLPSVAPSDILIDLRRRDFTMNAMAMRLSDGALLDPYDGQQDVKAGMLRILHPASFVDDPTRMLRGARYAARFGFGIDADMSAAIEAGLPHLRALSGERVKYDLELIFLEPQPERALSLLFQWGVFRAMGLPVPDPEQLTLRFDHARQLLSENEWPLETHNMPGGALMRAIGWGALIYNSGQLGISRLVEWIPFESLVREALVSLGALGTINAPLFRARRSKQSDLLGEFNGLALLLGYLFEKDTLKRKAMLCEWKDWRWVKPVTTGDDLKVRGLKPGPAYAQILQRLRKAWLDDEIKSYTDELALLETLIKES
jgi:tRNA nucleotidyltransferase (CCA-adding enzyme)